MHNARMSYAQQIHISSKGCFVQAYAKINAQGQWIDRSETVNLNELFDRMTQAELERYAQDGTLPAWFHETAGTSRATQDNKPKGGD